VRLLLRLFPARWQARYGDEFLALLEDQPASRRMWLDLIRCLIAAHLEGRTPPASNPTPRGGKGTLLALGLLGLASAAFVAVFAAGASYTALTRVPELLEAVILIVPMALAVTVVRAYRRDADRPLRAALPAVAAETFLLAVLGVILVATLKPQLGFFEQSPFGQSWLIELRPFHDLVAATTDTGRSEAVAIIAGNLVLFMSFGFAVALQRARARFALCAAIIVGTAIALEIGQAVLGTGRPSDVTAVLVRVVGGSLGYVLWQLPRKLAPVSQAART
jgi:glycopeptide antibiotics resistance protein